MPCIEAHRQAEDLEGRPDASYGLLEGHPGAFLNGP